jgi:two-component system, sensor histidine kinase and response regulator
MSKILVIDDEGFIREMIRLALEQADFEVIEAAGSSDGVTKAQEQRPDLILCDVNMGRPDAGYLTLAKLREDPATAAIPFILMTGLADAAGMRHGMDLGADDYLPKPFKVEELYATVNARLRKAQTVRAEAEKKLSLLRSQISFMLPHEMRTPLNGIISNAELLAANEEMPLAASEIAVMGREISQSGQRLERLIENFLIYAQLEIVASDPQSISRLRAAQTHRPSEIIRAAAREQAETAGRPHDLALDLADAPVPMAEDYFKKIAVELVQNALKFSNAGRPVRVRLLAVAGVVDFSVQDEGRGFSTDQINRVGAYMQFERKMHDEQGFGLGLAIAKKLVELHGGELTIDSTPGLGSTVNVTLPTANKVAA